MDTKGITGEVKTEISKALEKLEMLRDEAKLHLHLATLDAKKEWSDKLEPHIEELQRTANQLSETSRTTVHDLVGRVEGFVAKLRGQANPPPN